MKKVKFLTFLICFAAACLLAVLLALLPTLAPAQTSSVHQGKRTLKWHN
ncbi:hypothetical protein [Brasilonema sp. UFV-L1]